MYLSISQMKFSTKGLLSSELFQKKLDIIGISHFSVGVFCKLMYLSRRPLPCRDRLVTPKPVCESNQAMAKDVRSLQFAPQVGWEMLGVWVVKAAMFFVCFGVLFHAANYWVVWL